MVIVSIIGFVAILSLMVLVHELGHFILARRAGVKIEEFGFGYPPRLFAIKRGETEYSLNVVPLGGFVKLLGEEDPTDPESFARAKKRWRIAILAAGSIMNLIMAVVFFSGSYMAGWPTPVETQVRVSYVMPNTPAAASGLRSGDVIETINGERIEASNQLRPIAEANRGQEVTVQINRDGNEQTVKLTPRTEWPANEGPIGIAATDYPTKVEPVRYPFFSAIVSGAKQAGSAILFILYLPVMLIRGMLPLEMARPVGPVAIYQITSQATAETVNTGWWFPILDVAGLLAASLGVANLLPIPGLDGGRLLFVLIEAVRGKRVSPEREGLIHLVGMMSLLALVVVVSYFDIFSPVPGIDWGIR